MVENLGRKITLIVSLMALSVLSLVIGGFRLGLDLEGGTRLVYSLDLDAAVKDGQITAEERANVGALWAQIREILIKRLDPQGVREPIIRMEGEERFVIELPGSAARLGRKASVPLAQGIEKDSRSLTLEVEGDAKTVEDVLAPFRKNGAQVTIGNEKIRYSRRVAKQLLGLERNYGGESAPVAHAAGTTVELTAVDPWRDKIENVGSLAFYIQAKSADLGEGNDVESELTKAREWVRAHPEAPISEYNSILVDENKDSPLARLRFFPMAPQGGASGAEIRPLDQRLEALILEENQKHHFTGSDVQSVYPSRDTWGLPAVGFSMKTEVQSAFYRFTKEHQDERMAIVINDEIATFPNIDEPLPGSGIIRGDFTPSEVTELITVLRSGSLPLRPKFEGQETVGATLGSDYVKRGFTGIALGLGLVLIFMLVYYRRLGMFAALSLLINLLLLTGALAFLQATLTLPGVAGILLTIGMAVDANILIYERIREEAARGRKPLQSAKDGFGNALSTIVDANLTTLITGLILYKFGTGPVRGFATTLCIGIVTSMFSALLITRVLVHLQLEKGIERFSMARLIHETKIRFMSLAKPAVITSCAVVAVGVGLYAYVDEEDKLGIDFLGGTTMSVRLDGPHTKDDVLTRVQAIGGIIGESAEVKPIRTSAVGDQGYTRFRITAKGSSLGIEMQAEDAPPASDDAGAPDAVDETGSESSTGEQEGEKKSDLLNLFRSEVARALEDILQKGPIEDLTIADGTASAVLYLQRADHPTEDLAAELAILGVSDATVDEVEVQSGVGLYRFEGTVEETKSVAALTTGLEEHFTSSHADSNGLAMALASPIEEVNAVGAQVVSELRDKAMFAILLSLFCAVMYIRVRFAEYSFGFAAVVALTHDVLITLGAIAFADMFIPFIDTEINLPMIAAFLTIIGYSLNDTIVVFDRVRENLPRMKGSLAEIIDRSINQCLSRTVLTSLTTLISVGLLLAFNVGTGNVIEGFAFALIVGVVVGTYSSMFIASPVLLWLETRRQHRLEGDRT